MRGHVDPQNGLFSFVSVEERIPADHPLRRVKARADAVLASMGPAKKKVTGTGAAPWTRRDSAALADQ